MTMKNIIGIISKGEGLTVEFKTGADPQMMEADIFRSNILQPLLDEGILALSIQETPKSPKQKYYSRNRDES